MDCPSGFIATAENLCQICNLGEKTHRPLVTVLTDVGPSLEEGSRACTACEIGKYQDEYGIEDTCKLCPVGKYADETGLDTCKIAELANGRMKLGKEVVKITGVAMQDIDILALLVTQKTILVSSV